jgi:tRNA-2-methylthio-N6-dimethylallyladenosine synthase
MKYNLVTFGCQMNKSDSERFRAVIEGMGYQWTQNEEEADLLGVLACSVRQKSIDRVYARIHKWNKWKNNKNLITFISGCILQADKEKFLKLFDLIFEANDLTDLPDIISQYGIVTPIKKSINVSPVKDTTRMGKELSGDNKHKYFHSEDKVLNFWEIKPLYNSSFEAYVPIQNGCDKFCTFCAVPYTRGREISRPSAEILNEIKYLVNKGYKSITLLGQNVNSYGMDRCGDELTFTQLLKKIGEYGKSSGMEFLVYFTSPHPRDMTDEVIEVIASYRCLANHIHLPLQSGDNKILEKMNRKHTVEEYYKIINSVRQKLPEATIFTDIIVGFAGETEEQFQNTRKVMKGLKFNMAYIAQYSPRPGAVSYKWTDNVPGQIKRLRLHILTDELKKHSLEFNKKLIGEKIKVLVTSTDRKPGFLSGITEGRIIVRFKSEDESLIGRFIYIIITSAAEFAAEGRLVSETKPQLV